jgi:tetratricopeptide (TPR) repeat protein
MIGDFAAVMVRYSELSQAGKLEEAISLLESSVLDPLLSIDERFRAQLAVEAGLLSQSMGDLERSYRNFGLALKLGKQSPTVFYFFARVCANLGKSDESRIFFKKCHDQASASGEQDFISVLEAQAADGESNSQGPVAGKGANLEERIEGLKRDSLIARLSESARRVLHRSATEAKQVGASEVDTEHLAIAVLEETGERLGELSLPTTRAVRNQVRNRFGETEPKSGDLPMSDRLRKILQFAADEADLTNEHEISAVHLLIGLLRDEDG